MQKHYIVLTPNVDTFTNPTMVALFETLQHDGDSVVLFGPKQVVPCPENIKNVDMVESVFRLNFFRNPKFLLKQLKTYRSIVSTIKKYDVKTVMVVDPLGVIAGGRLKKYFCKDVKISYLSFEIFFKNELSGHYLKLKEKEIYYSKYIDSLLIQDEVRKELIFKENSLNLPSEKVALVPVSPNEIKINNVVDVRSIFGISNDKKLVIYSGSVGKWCGTDAIIEMFDKGYWPQTHHLVFHTRRPISANDKYYSDLMRLDKDENISFTLHANPFDSFAELGSFLKGFDVALALYYPNNENAYYGMNMQEIGLSSGKFSMYMMLGLPTIVTPCRTYNTLAEKYKFGAILNNINEISPLLNSDYNREEARRLYDEVLRPNIHNYLIIL